MRQLIFVVGPMMNKICYLLLIMGSLHALQTADFPARISISVTALSDNLSMLSSINEMIKPVLKDFGYEMGPRSGDYGDFHMTVYVNTGDKSPRYLIIEKVSVIEGFPTITIYTKGELKDGNYTGHDDGVTFEIVKKIKGILNPTRIPAKESRRE